MQNKTNPSIFYAAALLKKGYDTINPCCQQSTDGDSPTEIFGLDRNQMEKILNGLTINYPDFLNASFTLDLDNITLNSEKTSQDVLNLF